MLFRDHRGTLVDSMMTTQTVNTIEEIKNHINKVFSHYDKICIDIIFTHAGLDKRIGWDTYYVSAKFEGESDYMIVGMSDSEFKPTS